MIKDNSQQHRYFVIYKPYGMLPQFTDDSSRPVLGDLFAFPKDVYPVGRLDMDSEGLLLITDDKSLNHKLLNPKFKHSKEYLVQVDGAINQEAITKLERGVIIKHKKMDYKTLPAKAKIIDVPSLPERNPPIRYRKSIPTSWISLTLGEGKNRQVRKMTASVGFPTLRLVRDKIENLTLGEMKPGEVIELEMDVIYKALKVRISR
jgi:23S rRNA pseudouridine2457 synthase